MKMKFNQKVFNGLTLFLTFISLVCSILALGLSLNQPKTANDIFEQSKYSVVELRAYNNESQISYGSAVFIDDDGTLVSNAHVICYKQSGVYYEYENLEIRFCFEENYRTVTLKKYNLDADISILKIDDIDCLFVPIKVNESNLKSGQRVYAIGNGMNHGISITEGIISLPSINIEYEGYTRIVIQCDLIINDGNSGGALVNQEGELIGITTFRLLDNYSNVIYGTAYCLPISYLYAITY